MSIKNLKEKDNSMYSRIKVEPSKYAFFCMMLYYTLYVYNVKGLLSGSMFNYIFIAVFALCVVLLFLKHIRLGFHHKSFAFLAWVPFIALIIKQGVRALYLLIFLTFLLLFISPPKEDKVYVKASEFLFILSVFHAIGVYLQLFFPTIMSRLMSFLLSDSGYYAWQRIVRLGYRSGFTHQTSHTALYLMMGLLCMIHIKTFSKYKKVLLTIFFMIPLLLQGKRTHVVLFVALLLVSYIMMENPTKRVKNSIIIGVTMLGAWYLMLPVLPILSNMGGVFGRIFSTINIYVEQGFAGVVETSGRNYLYETALQLYRKNPVFGNGWGQFQVYLGQFYESVTAVHNVYIQLLCEVGIIGLGCFLIGQINMLARLFKCRNLLLSDSAPIGLKRAWKIAFFGQAFFTLYCFTGNPLYNLDYLIFYLLSIVLNEKIYQNQKDEKQKKKDMNA